MQEILKIIIGVAVLALGIPIGNLLAKSTNEELKEGKKWFILLILISLVGAILSIIFNEDALLFTLLFIAIVTSRSLGNGRKHKLKSKKRDTKK